ncbi:hypothetical protein KIN20_014055 [Parelaphostrongylus tenuis]|uniref:Uncharacterized protein n=1 Tax=Parelaphostrongylus tenuis TaxID=148309 RepID=A0AAD5N2S0_PARTN|nr:hypothetical protein KIN20_014055 [Parelaphostrongylus tenuis]
MSDYFERALVNSVRFLRAPKLTALRSSTDQKTHKFCYAYPATHILDQRRHPDGLTYSEWARIATRPIGENKSAD